MAAEGVGISLADGFILSGTTAFSVFQEKRENGNPNDF
jgi:hypothetical protein